MTITMTSARSHRQDGFALIEVVVTAALVVAVAVGALAAFDSASRASGNARARAEASALAQRDQERLRALSPSQLSSFTTQVTPVSEGGNAFTVTSTATWRSDPNLAPTCAGDAPSTDYLQITSKVTGAALAGQAVQEDSLVALPKPPSGGTVVVQAIDRQQKPLSGVTVSLTGTRTATATTGTGGCVIWNNVPAGTDTVTMSRSGYVDVDGNSTITKTVTVANSSTTEVGPVQYDQPGTILATFWTKVGTTTYTGGTWDRISVAQSGMTQGTRRFGTVGTFATSIRTSGDGSPPSPGLFPFTTAYSVYAGDCTANNPGASADKVTVTPGAVDLPVSTNGIHMPPVDLYVQGSTTGRRNSYTALQGANISFTPTDSGCTPRKIGPWVTDATGHLSSFFPALPWGNYTICGDYNYSGTVYHVTQPLPVTSFTSTTQTLSFDPNTIVSGACP